jgi:glucose 1-dehydrogenase
MMKAIVLEPGTTHVQVQEWEEPKIENPDDVKVRILQVGICGTDREEASGGRADAPSGEHELVLGHEMFGQVVEVGPKAKKIKVGDYVVITVRRGCGRCAACALDCTDMCYTGGYTERGIKQRHGFQAQFVVDRREHMLKVPEAIKSVAVLTEPTTVVEKAIDEAVRIQAARLPDVKDGEQWLQGRSVLVAGLGPIGLLAAFILRLRGAEVYGLDVVDADTARPKILEAIGGTYVDGRAIETDHIPSKYGPMGLIVEAAGIPKLDFDLLEALAINGVCVLTGVPGDGRSLSIEGGALMRALVLKNQVMFGSVNAGPMHFARAIEDLESAHKQWPEALVQVISHRYSPEEATTALHEHRPDEIKAIVDWEQL